MADQTAKPSAFRGGVWAHTVAWAALVVALATVCAGGLVTSYSAGMAVPDWPTTFGRNPLLYPLRDWLAVWDVLIAHGHRMLGFLLGGLICLLAVLLGRAGPRPTVRWLGLAALAVYCTQEGLGGFRVLCDEILLANLHACIGPLLLAIVAALVVVTSPSLGRAAQTTEATPGRELRRWTLGAVGVAYAQILLGAQLRHLPVDMATEWFGFWVWLHLIVAGALLAVAISVAVQLRRCLPQRRPLRRRAAWLVALALVQLALRAGTWVTQFGWPGWFTDLAGSFDYTVVAEGRLQVLSTTGQVVVGALCLVVATSVAIDEGKRSQTADNDNSRRL